MKQSKAEVHYEPKAKHPEHICRKCVHFIPLYGVCRRVDGEISTGGWCELFKAKG